MKLLPRFLFLFIFSSCSGQETYNPALNEGNPKPAIQLYQDSMLADGFDFPFGDRDGKGDYTHDGKLYKGWYIATHTAEEYSLGIHTGEDWNGNGGGNTDLGQPIYSSARGKVLAAKNYGNPWGNVVMIEHHYMENGIPGIVYSLYAHLDKLMTTAGSIVEKGFQIGTVGDGEGAFHAHLHFEMRSPKMKDYAVTYWPSSDGKSVQWVKNHYFEPSAFIKSHRKCEIPSKKSSLLVAIKHEYKIYLLKEGKIEKTWDIALSQEPVGRKIKQGDNRLPEGAYKIIQKSKGPFSGDYAEYFGPVWMRINYPNNTDAEIGYKSRLITQKQLNDIKAANNNGLEPPKGTALGGGIGIHGWVSDWPLTNRHLTWGCISMRNKDLPGFYQLVDLGTEIYISP